LNFTARNGVITEVSLKLSNNSAIQTPILEDVLRGKKLHEIHDWELSLPVITGSPGDVMNLFFGGGHYNAGKYLQPDKPEGKTR
jgi:hypothetical protein